MGVVVLDCDHGDVPLGGQASPEKGRYHVGVHVNGNDLRLPPPQRAQGVKACLLLHGGWCRAHIPDVRGEKNLALRAQGDGVLQIRPQCQHGPPQRLSEAHGFGYQPPHPAPHLKSMILDDTDGIVRAAHDVSRS